MVAWDGSPCDAACTSFGGCVQAAFDANPSVEEMMAIAEAVGIVCADYSPGFWTSFAPVYIQHTPPDPGFCWYGAAEGGVPGYAGGPAGPANCNTPVQDSGNYRLCPCALPSTLTPTQSVYHTPTPSPHTLSHSPTRTHSHRLPSSSVSPTRVTQNFSHSRSGTHAATRSRSGTPAASHSRTGTHAATRSRTGTPAATHSRSVTPAATHSRTSTHVLTHVNTASRVPTHSRTRSK